MMKTFGSVSITSHRSSDSVSSEATDEVWSPEPSSGYGSADDEHPSYDLQTPTRTTPGRRSLSESSSGISSRSLLSLSLSEALSLTFCESPPPSPPPPPPPDDVLPFQDLVDSRSPGSSIDYESSLSSAVPTPSNDEFPPRIISFQPEAISFLGRLQPSIKRNSYLEKRRGVEPQTVTKVASHSLPSDDIQTDLSSIETNSVQDPSEDSRSHKRIRLQQTSCSEENNDLSYAFGSRMTAWSSRSCSIHLRKKAIIDEVRKEQCEIPAALVNLQFDGSVVEEESLADDDMVCLVTAEGDLKKLLPIAEVQRSSDGKPVSTTQSHRLPAGPRIEPRRNFDTPSPEHSTGLFNEENLHRFNHDDFDREFSATDCYEAPHFTADTNSTSSTATPTSSPTPIPSTTSKDSMTSTGSTSCIVPTVSKGYNNSVDLKAFRIAVGLFHSYAAVKETPESSCHSATSLSCSPQLHDLSFIGHDTVEDLSYDPMLPDAQTTLPGHSRELHDVSMSTWSTTNEEVLQEAIEDACNVVHESSRSGNTSSLSTDSMQRIAPSKRSRSSSSCRQSSKRRRRHSSPALAELADHGYALKAAACGPASLHRSSTSPCVATVEEEESTADVSSVLAKLLLTEERLFPNEGSAGFIARRHCGQESAKDSAKSQDPSSGMGMSGSLLERLLTGQMDCDEIQKSEERVIRDRMEARPDNDDVADEEDVDLQLQDFDPGSLELENLEELWKNHGDLLGKFLA